MCTAVISGTSQWLSGYQLDLINWVFTPACFLQLESYYLAKAFNSIIAPAETIETI